MGIETLHTPGRRDRKKQQTRSALVTAALRLVDERGLDGVTVEEISAAVDVSPRTSFNYFATKDEAIIGDPLADGTALRDSLLGMPAGVPLLSALLMALGPSVEQIQADRDLWLLRMRVIKHNPALLPTLFARGAAAEEEFVAAIAERTGHPVDTTFPHLAAALTSAAFRTAMMRWAIDGADRRLSDFMHEAFGLLAAGLTEPPPAHPTPTTEEVAT